MWASTTKNAIVPMFNGNCLFCKRFKNFAYILAPWNWSSTQQKPVFNNMVCPQGWSLPLGEMFTLRSPTGVITLHCLDEWRSEQIISPPEDNFILRGQNSLLRDNFAPGGQSLSLGARFRMCLRQVWKALESLSSMTWAVLVPAQMSSELDSPDVIKVTWGSFIKRLL
jgi:hypothetical protein